MTDDSRKIIPFSHLALGGKFCYLATAGPKRVYVKIGNIRTEGCMAEWDADLIASNWITQGVYSLTDTGNDIDIEVVSDAKLAL